MEAVPAADARTFFRPESDVPAILTLGLPLVALAVAVLAVAFPRLPRS